MVPGRIHEVVMLWIGKRLTCPGSWQARRFCQEINSLQPVQGEELFAVQFFPQHPY